MKRYSMSIVLLTSVLVGCVGVSATLPPPRALTMTPASTRVTESAASTSSAMPSTTRAASVLPTLPPPPVPSATPAGIAAATQAPPVPASPTVLSTPLTCDEDWFTVTPDTDGACSAHPVLESSAAAQYFEKGTMIYVTDGGPYNENGGFYVILPTTQSLMSWEYDPITEYRDTSGEFVAPSGLYAPVSGFGIVWRGDNVPDNGPGMPPAETTFYQSLLGWATAPEFGYETRYQCGSGPEVYQVCILLYPDHRLVTFTMARGAITLWAWKFSG